MVDGISVGAITGGMRLKFLTVASDVAQKSALHLMTESIGQAVAVLADTDYYNALEQAMKIRKYVKQRNVAQLPKSVQDIIRDQQDEATRLETAAMDELKKAIIGAEFYVAGEHLEIKAGDAKSKIDQALEYLVAHVYSELDLITRNAETDADVIAILLGTEQCMPGMEPNRDAAAKMEEYLEVQDRRRLPTSMADVQSRCCRRCPFDCGAEGHHQVRRNHYPAQQSQAARYAAQEERNRQDLDFQASGGFYQQDEGSQGIPAGVL